MSFAAALTLAAAAAAPVSPPQPNYPSAAVLEAFGAVCEDVSDLKKVEAKGLGSGWAKTVPGDETPIGRLLAFGKSAGAAMMKDDGGTMEEPVVLEKSVAGEALTLVLSGIAVNGVVVRGCRLYDVAEERQISVAEAEAWMGRKADAAQSNVAVSVAKWKPGKSATHDSFELYYVPKGSPAIEVLKFAGVAMKADYVGEAGK